jgi:glutamate-ammonia-ligase adenylyltransferase
LDVLSKKIIEELNTDSERPDLTKTLVDLGFAEPKKSLHNLYLLNKRVTTKDSIFQIISLALSSSNPDLALIHLERIISAYGAEGESRDLSLLLTRENLRVLITTCANSPALVNIIIKDPSVLEELFHAQSIQKKKEEAEMIQDLRCQLEEIGDYSQLCSALRNYRNREILRIGMRDLAGIASLEDTMAELSDLASACLQIAYEYIWDMLTRQFGNPKYIDQDGQERDGQFVIMGLGKLGARELNFSSDIDLMYLYSSDKGETTGSSLIRPDQPAQKLPLPQFYTRLAELITRAIGEPQEEGLVFRVDLRLRPEGAKGNLANSLRSAEIYYESWGQAWERMMLLKARPVAGAKELGIQFLKLIEPFIYRKYLDYTMMDEIREMKEEIDRRVTREELKGKNIKLGSGGIREIEFFIQVLQLINGGKDPTIREPSTLKALAKLKMKKYISPDTCQALDQAYKFLRQVEHKIQIVHTRQCHILPSDRYELLQLARRLGYKDSETFLTALECHTKKVKEFYGQLFYTPGQELQESTNGSLLDLLREDLPQEEVLTRLKNCGFKDPGRAQGCLRLLKEGPPFVHFSPKANQLLKRVSPIMLQELIRAPDPDAALANLESFLSSVGARTTFLSLLAENPSVIKLLVRLFGGSDYLARLFIQHPELLDSLVQADIARVKKSKAVMSQELSDMFEGITYYEEALDQLRRFKNAEVLRIGMAALSGKLDSQAEAQQLTALSEICLQKAYEISTGELKARYGYPLYHTPKGQAGIAQFTIIALGKLGAREMSYNSDLDIIFIYSHEGETHSDRGVSLSNHEYFVKLAQKIITTLSCLTKEGYVFKVDTRLRPSGNAGPLVSSLNAFRAYHEKEAKVWERQVLTKSRWVAGNKRLGAQVLKLIFNATYNRPLTPVEIQEIHRLRMRMENELAQETKHKFHLKLGKGGLIDIQFIVQLLQLKYGSSQKKIRERNTGLALKKLYKTGLLSEENYLTLIRAWEFFTEIENKLRIAQDRSLDTLVDNLSQLDALARRLAYSHPQFSLSGQQLLEKYKHHSSQVRQLYVHYFS